VQKQASYGWKGKQVAVFNVLGKTAQYKQYGFCNFFHSVMLVVTKELK